MEQIGLLHDGQIYDLQTAEALNIKGDIIKADDSKESLEILRHSCAHMMAQAIKELYPEAKFFVGPVVKEGFYYDFKVEIITTFFITLTFPTQKKRKAP